MTFVNKKKLPRATDLIIKVLEKSPDGVKTTDICKNTKLSKRQVRYALDSLLKNGVIVRYPNLHDLRVNLYTLAEQKKQE